jgi:hypothetical protein
MRIAMFASLKPCCAIHHSVQPSMEAVLYQQALSRESDSNDLEFGGISFDFTVDR